MNDERNALLEALDPVQRQIIDLSIQEVSIETIANTVKRSTRTVRREIERFEENLERLKM